MARPYAFHTCGGRSGAGGETQARKTQGFMIKQGRGPTATDADRDKPRPSGVEQEADVAPRHAAAQSFIRGVIDCGEAGHYDADGKLPLRFKYAIIGTHPDGLPIIKRVRT